MDFKELSTPEEQQMMKNKKFEDGKQKKDFVFTDDTATNLKEKMKAREMWFTQEGGATKLNVKLDDGEIYSVLLTKVT